MSGMRKRNHNRDPATAAASGIESHQGKSKISWNGILILLKRFGWRGVAAMFVLWKVVLSNTAQITTTMDPTTINHNLPVMATSNSSNFPQESLKRNTIAMTKPDSKAAKCVYDMVTKHTSATTDSSNSSNKERRKPILYLFPGPPKTATTTVQQLLTDYHKSLAKDRIVSLGKKLPRENWNCGFPQLSNCIMYEQYADKGPNNCTSVLAEQLHELHRLGADAVVSDEVIGIMFAKTGKHAQRAKDSLDYFFRTILAKNWEVRIFLGYRPYFDFVKSQFHQKWTAREEIGATKWKKSFLHFWPGQGQGRNSGKPIPPLHQDVFAGTNLKRVNDFPNADELVYLFRPYADILRVYDVGSGSSSASTANQTVDNSKRGDLGIRLFCEFLENAHQACDSLKAAKAAATTFSSNLVWKNVAVSLDYDRIATAARPKFFPKTRLVRNEVAFRIRKFVEEAASNTTVTATASSIDRLLPMVCPSRDQTNMLYNISLGQEMKLFPERNPHWETKALFDVMMEQKKLCSVDTKKVLEQEEWKEFLRSFEGVKPKPQKNPQ